MNRTFFKPFALLFFCVALLLGMDSIALAGPLNNNNVSDCLKNPEKCEQGEGERAPGNGDGTASEEQTVGVTAWDFLKMIAALVFVVALIYFLLRFVNQKSRSYQQTKLIQHLGGSPLGGNRSIQMVKVGDRVLILGVSEDIKLLKEIDDKEEYEQFIQYYSDQLDQMVQPKDVVTQLVQKWKNKRGTAEKVQEPSNFKKTFEASLKEIKKSREQVMKEMKGKENQQDE